MCTKIVYNVCFIPICLNSLNCVLIKFMLLGILMCMYFYIQFTNNFWIPFENITTMCRKSLKDMYPLLSVSSILNMFSTKSEFGFTARAWANSSYWKRKKNNTANLKPSLHFFPLCIAYLTMKLTWNCINACFAKN